MTELFRRDWAITVGDYKIVPRQQGGVFSAIFDIQKSVQREPNTCSCRIANLSQSVRRQLEQGDDLQIEIKAGYVDAMDVIFSGDIDEIWSEKDGPEKWLSIEAKDGGKSYRTTRVNRGFEPGVSLSTLISSCVDAMGVGRGNLSQITQSASLDSGGSIFSDGYTLEGVAWRELDELCRSSSLRWSVQNGNLQLRATNQPAESRAIRLTSNSGLIGTPKRGKKERGKRFIINAQALLIPGLYPGRVVQIESSEVSGNYLCRRVRYNGETTGQSWYADLELQEY